MGKLLLYGLFGMMLAAGPSAGAGFEEARRAVIALRSPVEIGPEPPDQFLTVAKHRLRDWLSAELAAMPAKFDLTAFTAARNAQLEVAGLFCDEKADCESQEGYLRRIRIEARAGFLVAVTGFQRGCSVDESAYLFERTAGGWRRVWHSEQTRYSKEEYKPQWIRRVLVAPGATRADTPILTLGVSTGCASAWHSVYYRAYRLGDRDGAPPHLQAAETAFNGHEIAGSLSATEILIEFRVASMDTGVHNRAAIRRFTWTGSPREWRRAEPWALSPRDYVEESLQGRKPASFPTDRVEFLPTTRCTSQPDLWQVGAGPASEDTSPTRYFLVRWQPPYRFTLVDQREQPWEDCTEPDEDADAGTATLFPGARPER